MPASTPSSPSGNVATGSVRTYPVDLNTPLHLTLANDAGRTTVLAVDREDVLVRSSWADETDSDAPTALAVVALGNDLSIAPDEAYRRRGLQVDDRVGEDLVESLRGILRGFVSSDARPVDIVVELPNRLPSLTLRSTTASGEVRVSSTVGTTSIKSASGAVAIDGTAGELRVETASGDTVVRSHRGGVEFSSASADLFAANCHLSQFACRTASGDVRVERSTLAPTTHAITTVSGDVSLALDVPEVAPADAVRVSFASVSGEARLGAGVTRVQGREIERASSGGILIRARTTSGDVTAGATSIKGPEATSASARAGSASAPPSPTPGSLPDDPEQERLAILSDLERGRIDIEDAMRRLDDLDRGRRETSTG